MLRTGAWGAALGALAPTLLARDAAAQQKVPKSMVKYQDKPSGKHECANCSNFLPPRACRVVQGTIGPHGWCTIWTPK
jgi:hypothetical protein